MIFYSPPRLIIVLSMIVMSQLSAFPTGFLFRVGKTTNIRIPKAALAPLRERNVVDVEFERSSDDGDDPFAAKATATDPSRTDSSSNPSSIFPNTPNLLDLSLDAADEDWKNAKIPFLDYQNANDRCIDCRIAFTMDLDDEMYAIALPWDAPVVIVMEQPSDNRGGTTTVTYSPDDTSEDTQEILNIMATQLQEHVSSDLKLVATPKILTVSGPLEEYTQGWENKILPEPVPIKDLRDDSDEDMDFFLDFMKKELGEEEYKKTMKEDPDDIPQELLDMFNVPGLGDRENDEEGMKAILDSMMAPPEKQTESLDSLKEGLLHDGVALKLVSYIFPDGKSYSLVKLLKPYALVGKYASEDGSREDGDIYFQLLSPEEEKLVIPRIEENAKKDLEDAGLVLQP